MKNKKVALLTWHYYTNVGSNIQAYALSTAVKKLGYDPCFINYRYKKFSDNILKKFLKGILIALDKIFVNIIPYEYKFRVSQFQKKYFNMTKEIYDKKKLKELNKEFDIFMCGSDQIWAPIVYDDVYFLSFVDTNKYKFSYAPSIGLDTIPDDLKLEYKKLLQSFDDISVRENTGKMLLQEIGIDSKVVLDPSYLLSKEEWLEISDKNIGKNEEYIFCYFLGENKKFRETVNNFNKKSKLKIVIYSSFDLDKEFCNEHIRKMGPSEFISFINNANYVFTDSFHGISMSTILQKQFYCFLRFDKSENNNQNSRVYNILNLLQLNEQLIEEDVVRDNNIDYSKVNEKLKELKEDSINFLEHNLRKGTLKNEKSS